MNTDGATKATEFLGQFYAKTVEGMTVWAEANQRMLRDLVDLSVGAAKEGVRLLEGNAQAVTRSAERLQASAEQAGKGIQETFEATVTRMKGAYTQN